MRCSKNVNRADYEVYTIKLPGIFLSRNKIERFIYAELGKLHPAFSETSRFDYKLKLEKKALYSKVVVIENFILMDLMKKNKRGIYIDFFKKRFFKKGFSAKKKGYLWFILLFIVAAFLNYKIFFRENEISEVENIEFVQVSADMDDYPETGAYLQDFLSFIKSENGKIDNLSWASDGFREIISASVSGVFPERLNSLDFSVNCSTVSFERQVPKWEISFSQKVDSKREFIDEQDLTLGNVRSELREVLFKMGGTILSENLEPFRVRFFIQTDFLENLLFSSAEILSLQNEFFIKSMQIDSVEDGYIVEWEFQQSFYTDSKFILNGLGENINLLVTKKRVVHEKSEPRLKEKTVEKKEPLKINLVEEKVEKTEEKSEIVAEVIEEVHEESENQKIVIETKEIIDTRKMKKLGQVIHEDGRVVCFYKDTFGKIITVEQEVYEDEFF